MSFYLVTGGAGFIGSHLVGKLVEKGDKVIVLDDFSSGNRDNISRSWSASVEIIEGDVRDAQLLDSIALRADGIFHLAAIVSVPRSIEEPGLSFDINARGTQIVLDAARKAGGKKVVLASSAAVYGNNVAVPLNENSDLAPLSPYGLEKLIGEKMGEMYAELYNMDVTALRFFNVFGPRQDPSSSYSGVISIFVDKLIHGEPPIIYGDGKQTRDFIYVEDIVNAAMTAMVSQLHGFHVYNLGRGEGVSVNMVWKILCENIVPVEDVKFGEERISDIRFSIADISHMTKGLGYMPRICFADGLRKTYEWAKLQMHSF